MFNTKFNTKLRNIKYDNLQSHQFLIRVHIWILLINELAIPTGVIKGPHMLTIKVNDPWII